MKETREQYAARRAGIASERKRRAAIMGSVREHRAWGKTGPGHKLRKLLVISGGEGDHSRAALLHEVLTLRKDVGRYARLYSRVQQALTFERRHARASFLKALPRPRPKDVRAARTARRLRRAQSKRAEP